MKKMFLKESVKILPLVNHWYANSFNLCPAFAAKTLVNHQIKILESFIQRPEIHEQAWRNPALVGGAFLDTTRDKVNEVATFLAATKDRQKALFDLAQAIDELDQLIVKKEGEPLDKLYDQISPLLRGRIELFYDRFNRPGYRFIEALFYEHELVNPEWQGVLLVDGMADERRFILSTPMLFTDGLYIPIALKAQELDLLYRARYEAIDVSELAAALGVEDSAKLLPYLDEQKAQSSRTLPAAGVAYWGHACVSIAAESQFVIVDPAISTYQPEGAVNRYTLGSLPKKIDCVMITHNHQDHLMIETLLELRHRVVKFVVPASNGDGLLDPSLRLLLSSLGFRDVVEISEAQCVAEGAVRIIGLPFLGEHGDLGIRSKLAYHVEVAGHGVVLAADSKSLQKEMYDRVQARLALKTDTLFIGMECEGAAFTWVYGSVIARAPKWEHRQARRLDGSNARQAEQIIASLKPKRVFVYALGQEPWLSHVMNVRYDANSKVITESNALIDACQAHGLEAKRLFGEYSYDI